MLQAYAPFATILTLIVKVGLVVLLWLLFYQPIRDKIQGLRHSKR